MRFSRFDARRQRVRHIEPNSNNQGRNPMLFLYRIAAVVAVLAPLFVAPVNAQAPERRFALVIGNSEYKAGRLPTAANDAGLIAETLRTAGFDVAGARDLDQDTSRRSIREILDKASAAGPQAVSFIYLAGYGLQFEGENYIIPADASIPSRRRGLRSPVVLRWSSPIRAC